MTLVKRPPLRRALGKTNAMKSKTAALIAGALILATASTAIAQEVRLRASRVGAPDPATVEKQGKFYAALLGLKETRRITRPADPAFLEIIMNFGPTVDAAKMAKTPSVVLITAPKGTVFPHPTSNLIFEVSDAKAIVDKAVAAGGTIERAPALSSNAPPGAKGPVIAFVKDPAGNRVELIQP